MSHRLAFPAIISGAARMRATSSSSPAAIPVRTFKITVIGVAARTLSRPPRRSPAQFLIAWTKRLDKEMSALRDPNPVEVVTWAADTEAEECDRIAETIQRRGSRPLPSTGWPGGWRFPSASCRTPRPPRAIAA